MNHLREFLLSGLILGGVLTTASAQPYEPGMQPGTSLQSLPKITNVSARGIGTYRDDYHRLGWQYNLFKMNIPLAWEITKGKSSITIGVDDDFFDNPSLPNDPYIIDLKNPELRWRTATAQTDANFHWLSGLGLPLAPYGAGDGQVETSLLYNSDGHGIGVMSVAVAKRNDTGMVGIAPNVNAVATPLETGGAGVDYAKLDVDRTTGNGITVADVMNCSYADPNFYQHVEDRFRDAVDAGVVVVAGAGNAMGGELFGLSTAGTPACAPWSAGGWRGVAPRAVYPGAFFWSDETKVIAVGMVHDGNEMTNYAGASMDFFDGAREIFPIHHNYSPGREKFPGSSVQQPIAKRRQAFIDLVAYHQELAVVFNGQGIFLPDSNYLWYRRGDGATSRATPQVSGTVALMRSIDKYLGVPLSGGKPSQPSSVQRKAYDILTFTARKAVDYGNSSTWYHDYNPTVNADLALPTNSCWSSATFPAGILPPTSIVPTSDLQNPQFNYTVQVNDALQRSWSQRMGFGVLDAYRAVAHAINAKGAFEYTASQSITGTAGNESGQNLIHFGSKRKTSAGAVVNVLDQGGITFPGNEISHPHTNNNGETRINGSGGQATVLTVSNNTILAVDGILRQTDPTRANNRIVTSGTGKILIAGYLDDVELQGNVQTGDLVVRSTGSSGTAIGAITVNSAATNTRIRGNVVLRDNGNIRLQEGTLTLDAGGTIDMQGSNDLIVEDGATLVMEYPSVIKGAPMALNPPLITPARRVVIKSGGKLIVKGKPSNDKLWKTQIVAPLRVEAGGEVELQDRALVEITSFTVDPCGTLTCKPGSHLVLPRTNGYLCNGRLIIGDVAQPGKRVTISGSILENDNSKITSQATINMTGSVSGGTCAGSGVPSSFLRAVYTDFKNVALDVRNVAKDPIVSCNFTGDRMLASPGTPAYSERLRITYSGSATAPAPIHPTIREATISNCTFSDIAAAYTSGAAQRRDKDPQYEIKGVYLSGLTKGAVEGSTFTKLQTGVDTYRSGNVRISGSTFTTCDMGTKDYGSALDLCSNTFSHVKFGTVDRSSRVSWVYDNLYGKGDITVPADLRGIGTAFQATTSARHFLRGNLFTEFVKGVVAEQSIVVMSYHRITGSSTEPAHIHGRNHFYVAQDPNYSAFLPRNSSGQIPPGGDFRDDITSNRRSSVILQCGFNKLATHSRFHLANSLPANPISFNVGSNEWPNPNGVFAPDRGPGVNTFGTPVDVSEPRIIGCIRQQAPQFTCTYGAIACANDPTPNDGTWTELASSDPALTLYYNNARAQVIDPMNSDECRRDKALDAIQAATLSSSVPMLLPQIENDLAGIAANPLENMELRASAALLHGEIQERRNNLAAAVSSYRMVTDSFPASPDSIQAAWRIQHIDAELADTTYGPAYDSLMALYSARVYDDLSRTNGIPVTPKPTAPEMEERGAGAVTGVDAVATLEQNRPNPFSERAEIRFMLRAESKVRLTVSDPLGRRIALLADGTRGAGSHVVEFDPGALPAGLYYYHLEVNGRMISRQMVLTK